MFRGLINEAKSAAGSLVARYLARVSVAVPFLAAFGFATAAITLMLVDRYGAIAAYWMIAAGFTAIGLVAALIVSVKEQEEEVADAHAEQSDTRGVATDAVAQAAVQAPLALLGALLTTPGGPSALVGGVKILGRNIPLVLLLAAIGFLLWPSTRPVDGPAEQAADLDGADSPQTVNQPNAAYPSANGLHREAA